MHMTKRTARRILLITALSALPLGAALHVQARPLPAAEQSVALSQAQTAGGTTILRASAAQRAEAAEAWTPEARRQAKPLAFPQNAVVASQAAAQPTGPARAASGRAPAAKSDRIAKQQFPQSGRLRRPSIPRQRALTKTSGRQEYSPVTEPTSIARCGSSTPTAPRASSTSTAAGTAARR